MLNKSGLQKTFIYSGLLVTILVIHSTLQAYQASESSESETITSQGNEPAQATELGQIRECNRGCSWLPGPLRFFCDYVEIPEFDNGGNPNCYRRDWDIDGDGVMEGPQENNT